MRSYKGSLRLCAFHAAWLRGGCALMPRGAIVSTVDLSFNRIAAIPDLSALGTLRELFIASNKVRPAFAPTPTASAHFAAPRQLTAISGLEHCRALRRLDLGSNRIRVRLRTH